MAFPARFKGTCRSCGNSIQPGQFITWSRREKGKASHLDCTQPDAIPVPVAPAVPSFDPAAMQAMIEAAMLKIMGAGAAMPAPVSVPAPVPVAVEDDDDDDYVPTEDEEKASATVAPVPVSTVAPAKTKALKDNAAWHDVLAALTGSFEKELVRLLIIGPPGTGKSKTSIVLTNTPYRVTMTEGMGVEDLIGMYQLVKGETVMG